MLAVVECVERICTAAGGGCTEDGGLFGRAAARPTRCSLSKEADARDDMALRDGDPRLRKTYARNL